MLNAIMIRVFTSKLVRRLGAALAVTYLVFIAFIWWSMNQPPETFGRESAAGNVRPGHVANAGRCLRAPAV